MSITPTSSSLMQGDEQDQCVVTGASRGIGAEIAQALWAADWNVLGLARKRPDWWRGSFIECDLSDEDQVLQVCSQIQELPRVSAVINNAADGHIDSLDSLQLAAMRQTFQVNVFSPALIVQAALQVMTHGGRVINIGSCIMRGKAGRDSYAASKAALASLTRTWAQELGSRGITCNMISPGPTETEGYRRQNPPGQPLEESVLRRIPTGRLNTPSQIATTVMFLLQQDQSQITGQVIQIDGGMTAG